jgi:uncharacterized protein
MKLFLPYRYILHDQALWLSPARCIFWENEKILILSDLHFGKSGHFRKEGIGIPQNIFKEDLQRLFTQIQFFRPELLLVTGDMFHSHSNKELDLFSKWRKDIRYLPIHLIKGNHDILLDTFYEKMDIKFFAETLTVNEFCFTHDFNPDKAGSGIHNKYFFSGHIHPGIKVSGPGKQSLTFPCFYFSDDFAVLPAFTRFSGLFTLRPKKKDQVFALVNNQVIKI